jgi:hypothetical protein
MPPAARTADAGPPAARTRHTAVMTRRRGRHERREGQEGRQRALPDFTQLPEPVRIADTVTTQEVDPAPDPQGGRDTETEFVLRNAGF